MEQKFVTRSDCEKIITKCLINNNKFEILTFKVKPFEDEEREYYKPDCILEISAKMSKNISRFRFFLKKCVTEFPALNDLLRTVKASEREILFYEHFLPMMNKALINYDTDFVPHYVYGQLDRIIVIEDMLLKFFTPAKKLNPHVLDRFHISLVLKATARLHAASFAYEEKLKDAEGARLFDENDVVSQDSIWTTTNNDLATKTIESGIKGVKALLKEYKQVKELSEDLNNQIDNLVNKCYDILKFQSKYRNALGHGDLQTKNILFKYDKNDVAIECVLLNFGFCRYFMPAYDVLTVIFNCSSQLFRQHYFTYLIKYYYECLHNELMKQELHINQFMTFEEFQQTINYLMPAIKLKALLHLEDFGAKPGFYKLVQKEEELHRIYMYKDKSIFVLEMYKKDPIFKEMINEALEEVIEVINTPQITREKCYEILESRLETAVYDLKQFSVSLSANSDNLWELTLELSEGGEKEEGVLKTYKYLIRCNNEDHKVNVQSQLM